MGIIIIIETPAAQTATNALKYPMNRISLIFYSVTVVITILMCWLIPSPVIH